MPVPPARRRWAQRGACPSGGTWQGLPCWLLRPEGRTRCCKRPSKPVTLGHGRHWRAGHRLAAVTGVCSDRARPSVRHQRQLETEFGSFHCSHTGMRAQGRAHTRILLCNDACRRGLALLGNSCYLKSPHLKQQILRFWLPWKGAGGEQLISGDFTGYFIQTPRGPG